MRGKALHSALVVLAWGLLGRAHDGRSQSGHLHIVVSTHDGGDGMLQDYSQRAGLVLFLARAKAGRDGSGKLEVKHLLEAIVMEDQGGKDVETILGAPLVAGTIKRRGLESRSNPFFRPDVASELLARLDAMAPHAEPVATSQDLPVSADLGQTLAVAEQMRRDRQAEKVEPLYLLSAALADRSSRAAQFFLEAGITREVVLDAIKGK